MQLNDWRKALETSQDWKWSDAVATMGKGAAVNNYEGSRELNRLMWEGVRWGNMGVRNSSAPDFETYVKDSANRTGEQDHGLRDTFGDYIMDTVLKDHMHALYQTQKLAAEEQGFGSLYGDSEASTALYLDTAKDMATASTAAELHEQLHQIDMMDDRSPKQRNYLAQKAQMYLDAANCADGFRYRHDAPPDGQGHAVERPVRQPQTYHGSSRGLREFKGPAQR